MNRHEARVEAVCLVFEKDFRKNESLDMIIEDAQKFRDLKQNDYIKDVTSGVFENLEEIDKKIKSYLKDWKLNRISRVSLAILRVALYEILFLDNIPSSVSINEAVEISKLFENRESASFINGILGSIVREL